MSNAAVPANPFPSSAVAQLSAGASSYLHIETGAISSGKEVIDNYVARIEKIAEGDTPSVSQGETIAVIGEYGTGKTHLVRELCRYTRMQKRIAIRYSQVDVPRTTALGIAQWHLLEPFGDTTFTRILSDILKHTIADELARSELMTTTSEKIRASDISPFTTMVDLGLDPTPLLNSVRAQIDKITKGENIQHALHLMLEPELQSHVWRWITGQGLSAALKEHGVVEDLNDQRDSDNLLFSVLGLLSYNKQYVMLVIDEAERIAYGGAGSDWSISVKSLAEAFVYWNGLLIVAGLPDFWEGLRPEVRDRFVHRIMPTPLSVDELERYIRRANEVANRGATLEPFSLDAVRFIRELTAGNARRAIRLCFLCYHEAISRAGRVSRDMIRTVTRDQYEIISPEGIAEEIAHAIEELGYAFERDYEIEYQAGEAGTRDGDRRRKAKADFRVELAEDEWVLYLIVTKSILKDSDANRIEAQVEALAAAGAQTRIIVVVNGFFMHDVVHGLRRHVQRIINYKPTAFQTHLLACIESIRRSYSEEQRASSLSDIRDAQGRCLDELRTISARVKALESSPPAMREVRAISRQVSEETLRAYEREGTSTISLPASLSEVFQLWEARLEFLKIIHVQMIDVLFGGDIGGRGVSRRFASIRKRLQQKITGSEMRPTQYFDTFILSLLLERFKQRIHDILFPGNLASTLEDVQGDIALACKTFSSTVKPVVENAMMNAERMIMEQERLAFELASFYHSEPSEHTIRSSKQFASALVSLTELASISSEVGQRATQVAESLNKGL